MGLGLELLRSDRGRNDQRLARQSRTGPWSANDLFDLLRVWAQPCPRSEREPLGLGLRHVRAAWRWRYLSSTSRGLAEQQRGQALASPYRWLQRPRGHDSGSVRKLCSGPTPI